MSIEHENKEALDRSVSTPDNSPWRDLVQDLWKPEARLQGSHHSQTRDDTQLVAQAGGNSPRESFGINKIDKGGTKSSKTVYKKLRSLQFCITAQ